MNTTIPQRYTLGKELTGYEIREAYKRIHNRVLPPSAKPADTARHLAAVNPLRFEFEVNRLRGFAWDNGECPALAD